MHETASDAASAAPADGAVPRETLAGAALRVVTCDRCEGHGSRLDERDAGHHIRDARTALNLSSSALARRLGVSSSYMIDLEMGRRAWTRELFCRVSDELARVRAEQGSDR